MANIGLSRRRASQLRALRLIVRNLPFNVSDSEILNFFPGALSLERHAKDGVLTGAVFIQCSNANDVKRFIKTHNNKEFGGRQISVAHLEDKEVFAARQTETEDENERGRMIRAAYEAKKGLKGPVGEEDRTLFITNLSPRETVPEITKAFTVFGEVEQVTLVSNKETGIPAGRAFVLFKEVDSAKKALSEQIILNERILVVLKYLSPETLRERESEKLGKEKARSKTIKERKEGIIPPRDPNQVSSCRVHISHMSKRLNRKSLAKIIEEYFSTTHGKKVKFRGVNLTQDRCKRNPGYGFVTFKFPEDAELFLQNQKQVCPKIGDKAKAEYAMESLEFLERGIKKKPSRTERLAKKSSQ